MVSEPPLDLVVAEARIADVVLQRIFLGWLGVRAGRFVYVEEGPLPREIRAAAREVVDAGGAVVQPGLVDAHMHVESSLLTPGRFAEAVVPWGTLAVLQDPHEMANVLGADGVRWMIRASRGLPLDVRTAVPSCVPPTTSGLETANAELGPDDVRALAGEEGVLALGEMMDYQGLLREEPRPVAVVRAGAAAGLSLEGHVPTLEGMPLSRYAAWGIRSDHTLATPRTIAEKLSKGMVVMLQEKSLTPETVAFVRDLPDRSRVLLVTDDMLPNRLKSGHLSRIVERAVALGWPPLDAVASASLRPAAYLGMRDRGLIAPGYRADFLIAEEVAHFPPHRVYAAGALAAEEGRALFQAPSGPLPEELARRTALRPVSDRWPVPSLFRVPGTPGSRCTAEVRVVRVNEVHTFTTLERRQVVLEDGFPAPSEESAQLPDLCAATVIARRDLPSLSSPGEVPGQPPVLSFVAGLGLRGGAFASSFAHDVHNLFVVGTSPHDMACALRAVLEMGGGMAVSWTEGGKRHTEALALPVAGLISDDPPSTVAERLDRLETALRRLGMRHRNPVLLLTILPLSVSPAFKISDLGIVDVEGHRVLDPVISLSTAGPGDC
ncbi:adenine deaminase C-terminal domain-containing protein [Carboxydochorda subterranea]|uniref:Adenine deaminase n=1 Tax=Carboxydichorda subterranea TaxID=3109565 RepID=A0ABZ1BYK6_9FIRM|nr:adenine deaminase C-terminal domain-containing protein [Limnochorda sp. L945t]WRP17566.1 adenine deaminase C-terminal domain-containing protein [Limnochorda sp. L945t]